MAESRQVVVRGAIAGFLGATALVIWFLLIDLIEGEPLGTPAFLAGALSGLEQVEIGFRLVAAYTILHYAVFLAVGVAVAWVLDKLGAIPGVLLGFVLGFLLFDLIFYAGVLITGVDVVRELGWPQVLFGNLLAGIVIMGYLHLTGAAHVVSWWEILQEHRIIREGLVGGLVGALAVAIWFFLVDALMGRLLFTPAALGSALILGAGSVAEVQFSVATVGGYTLLHVIAFVLVGLVAAAIATEAEREPPLVLAFGLLFATIEALFIGIMAIFAFWLLDAIAWWTIVFGNLIAALVVGVYLWREHPALRPELRRASLEEPT